MGSGISENVIRTRRRGKRQRKRLTSVNEVVQCAVQRAHQVDEARLAEADGMLI